VDDSSDKEMSMLEYIEPIKIAVNVMRARLTIIGFNIAVVSFQLDRIYDTPGGINIPGYEHAIHASSQISLLLAVALSMAAIVAYLFSSEYDQVGICTSWSMVAGDLLMYCALAATLAGFFAPLELSLNNMAEQKTGLSEHFTFLRNSILLVGSISWFLANYLGPFHALSRSPFPRSTNIKLTIGYLTLLGSLGLITATAAAIDATDASGLSIVQWLIEFVQPVRW
jgi:hypothetical protein